MNYREIEAIEHSIHDTEIAVIFSDLDDSQKGRIQRNMKNIKLFFVAFIDKFIPDYQYECFTKEEIEQLKR